MEFNSGFKGLILFVVVSCVCGHTFLEDQLMLANHYSGPFIVLCTTYDDYIVVNRDCELLILPYTG